jgi:hypothetical protein
LRDGKKERYISLQHISIQPIQIGMLVMICIQRRKGEHLLGKIVARLIISNRNLAVKNKLLLLKFCNLLFQCEYRCDRILWHGEGLHQLSYVRGESRFSDHRPVYGMFWAEVESKHGKLKKSMSCSRSRIQVEELLPYSHGYTELNFF